MELCQTIYKLNWVVRIPWKEQSLHPHPQRYTSSEKGLWKAKGQSKFLYKGWTKPRPFGLKKEAVEKDMMNAYKFFFCEKIISSTENMAYLIFSWMKLGGKTNEQTGFLHNMQKSHETPCCYDV